MPKTEKVLYVCKRCGAVGSIKQPHCALCGATFDPSMQLRPGTNVVKVDRADDGCGCITERKSVTLLGVLAAVLGIISAFALMLPVFSTGFLTGIAAVFLAIVSLAKKKGGKSLSVIGLVLGSYTVFVNFFYSIWKFIYFFID